MKLYSHPAGPRCHAFYLDVPTPAATYCLQQQLLRAYREVLFQWWDLDVAITTCFGPKQGKRLQAAEDRLQYEVPELLIRMSPDELELAASVFYQQTLIGFVWHVLSQERTLQHRLEEGNCRTRLDDDRHALAAGLGKGKPLRRPATVPLPEVEPVAAALPTPPAALPIQVVPLPRVAGIYSSPRQERLLLRVYRAQERRRLKRKRR